MTVLAWLVVFIAFAGNTPPLIPVVTEPAFDGKVCNPEDTHMETGPFADPDPGDTHAASDWEIWTVTPAARVWAALGVTGPEKAHIHLGDGVFEGSHAGRVSLMPATSYRLRARHRDSSGDPLTQWSPYAQRLFSTGTLSVVFAMEADDILDSPAPALVDVTGAAVTLPPGPSPGTVVVESAAGGLLLSIAGGSGGNVMTNPPALPAHSPIRVRLSAGGQPLLLPESDLSFTDHEGNDRVVYLPAVKLAAGQAALFWVSSNGSTYVALPSQTQPSFAVLARGAAVPWNVLRPGYRVEVVATGFQLPVNIAFVPNPGPQPDAPVFYVTELYGAIKVVRRDGTVGTYASGLLNFNPTGAFPGSGEQGVAGIVVEPATGDVFASLLYDSAPPNGAHYPKVVRFHSNDGGQTAATQTTILDMVGESQGQSHQISNLTIGPDGKLYVHMGDGFTTATAQNLDSYRGKVLRVNLDGTAPTDNPFYNATGGINARDYVFAYGLRNPFGGAWRAADGRHYEVENGPSVDRFARINAGQNYLWNGTDASMANAAIYNWNPATGPVNIAFIQPETFGGSGFPPSMQDHAFVSESGPTWGTGPQALGKRISEFVLNAAGGLVSGPTPLVEYNGSGKASCVGLAAGPDGLYFTDLYKDEGYQSPIDAGANVLRVRFVGAAAFSADVTAGPAPLAVRFEDQSNVPSPASWMWSFGDGATSTEPEPTHVYTQPGVYPVRLSVTGAGGPAVVQRNGFVRVGQPARVALIAGAVPLSAADQAAANRLASSGYVVTAYDDAPANRPDAHELAEHHELVVVSSTITSASVGGEFRTADIGLLFWEQGLLRTAREALADNGGAVAGTTTVNIIAAHPVTQGVALGNAAVYSPAATMSVGLGTIAPAATVLARRTGATDAAILAAERGSTLLSGYVAPDRRVFMFLEDTGFLSATPVARQLFDQAACWTAGLAPSINRQPESGAVTAGQPATFMVSAGGGSPMTRQWRRNGVPLIDGGRISGAATGVLTIDPALPSDAGSYDVVLSNACGGATSVPVLLGVSCYADCNADGVLTVADFGCFQTRFVAGAPYADCNGDGALTVADFGCFQTQFVAGCP